MNLKAFYFIPALLLLLIVPSCKKNDTPPPAEPAPTISAISPLSGPKNTVVTITGTGFGTSSAALKIYFNGTQGTIQTATDNTITATVPAGAGTGSVKVEKNSVQVTGPVFTYQGNGWTSTFSLSGTASVLNHPSGIVKDAGGNFFICDRDNHRIIRLTSAGAATVVAGSGIAGFADGTGTAAQFNQPYCITMDASGNLFVGDRINNAIRKITPAGVVTTLAGNGTAGNQNGTGSAARFAEPLGITIDGAGNLYVADYLNNQIRKVTPSGVVTTVTAVSQVFGIVSDNTGNLYFTEYSVNKVSKYSSSGVYSVIAGDGTPGTTDGTGSAARFSFPAGITMDASGNLYVSETFNNRLRKITSAGVVSTIAGSNAGYADGSGSAALFDSPIALAGDFSNNLLYIADFGNHKIRKTLIE